MTLPALTPSTWWQAFKRQRHLNRLRDPNYRFMWDAPPANEWVAFDCETTGLDKRSDDIIAIGAVRIVGNRIMSSERLELLVRPTQDLSAASVRVHRLREQDVAQGLAPQEAMDRLLRFIGSRPLVGYYLEFDIAMVNRVLRPWLGTGLPQPAIEVSALYYDYKFRQLSGYEQDRTIDLRFNTILQDLALPQRDAHDALNDAVMAALAFIKLQQLLSKP